ncbi:MAG: DUF2231 domain-containing protein [Candidatus Omnitrophica bacterium]|nr:DUF2231 domain-containing protein [Candidatus Omnitrophota bacterium]MDE2222605.1 DUF2231 domain-containing protein [Candidatus Omnitrophota bacterium]
MQPLTALLPGAAHLQNLHPIVVHFPIAFLTMAGPLYVLAGVLRREALAKTAFLFLAFGCLAAAVAAATGLYAQDGVMVAKSVREHLLHAHKQWMLAAFYLSIILTLWASFTAGFPKKGRLVFVLLSLLLIAVMAKGADYGGRMVYDYNAGGNACSQPIEFSR